MRKTNLILLIIIIAIATSIISYILYESNRIVQIDKFPMHVNVIPNDDTIGINVDPGFYFGSLKRGGGGRRELIINNVEEDVTKTEDELSRSVREAKKLLRKK